MMDTHELRAAADTLGHLNCHREARLMRAAADEIDRLSDIIVTIQRYLMAEEVEALRDIGDGPHTARKVQRVHTTDTIAKRIEAIIEERRECKDV